MLVVVIGANGQLGTELVKVLAGENVVGLLHSEIEVTHRPTLAEVFQRYKPHVVINTAAYHRVDDCELYPERAFMVNAVGVCYLSQVCRDLGAKLVHFSTDYVFDGRKREPYAETDVPNPLSVYGASKLAGECLIKAIHPQHFIVRTTGLYGVAGSRGKGGNFVELMLRLAEEGKEIRVVDDQRLTPTYTVDLARKVAQLIHTDFFGLYHITNHGYCTWYEFAAKIFEISQQEANLHRTTSAAFGARAARPAYSVLQHQTLEKRGMDDLRVWVQALSEYLLEERRAYHHA